MKSLTAKVKELIKKNNELISYYTHNKAQNLDSNMWPDELSLNLFFPTSFLRFSFEINVKAGFQAAMPVPVCYKSLEPLVIVIAAGFQLCVNTFSTVEIDTRTKQHTEEKKLCLLFHDNAFFYLNSELCV